MTSPMMERLTRQGALERIRELLASVNSSEEELAERADRFDLTEREAAVWDEVSELRWLIGA